MKSPLYALALTAPAVRTVIVHVYASGGGPDVDIIPVLAIRSSWDGENERSDFMVVLPWDDECPPVEASFAFNGDRESWRAVACTWPKSEDEEQLAWIVDAVRAQAEAKAAAKAAAKEAKSCRSN